MLTQITKEVFSFPIELPDTPLKSLNSYVIRPSDGGRCLLIDTGFHHPRCWEALCAGMREAGLEPENTDVFLTHAHADHTGNASALVQLGCRMFISQPDYAMYTSWLSGDFDTMAELSELEGMPKDLVARLLLEAPVMHYTSPYFPATLLEDGDELCYGSYRLRCIITPGHTPGHMCLYDENQELLFLGDHVLFDITPNIIGWGKGRDALRLYLESLRQIARLPVSIALPAHRSLGSITLAERVDQLIAHHRRRLEEALAVLREGERFTAYEVAAQLRWRIRANSWEEFPLSQKWFALGEALAHLEYLCDIGAAQSTVIDGVRYYFACDDGLDL